MRRTWSFGWALLLGALLLSLDRDALAFEPDRPASAYAVAARSALPVAQRAERSKAGVPAKRPQARVAPRRTSMGERTGLRATVDPLELKSSVALVVDQETDQVLFAKNPQAVLPIASITKLMTAIVVAEAGQDPDEKLVVTQDDVDTEKGSRSRLKVGTELTRAEMLHLALMASENRAAHALGRNYPGGQTAFVEAMNETAKRLQMNDTRFVEPTGLSSQNRSSARDLHMLVKEALAHPQIREMSITPETLIPVGNRQLQFRNTNGLVRNPAWEIGLQKTGYIAEAGRCLVMQAQLAGRKLIMVLLDSAGKYSRIGDAERIRRWVAQHGEVEASAADRR